LKNVLLVTDSYTQVNLKNCLYSFPKHVQFVFLGSGSNSLIVSAFRRFPAAAASCICTSGTGPAMPLKSGLTGECVK
jgi:hypothetical protein